ncbi:hypothetical protein HYALB_00005313 [Hymenoscyphus albidus]|uniref:Major facilitator superfamily (MFS) profile domain-containing protein n=1 Tax=Hymenoscyphus albidus TaxID=595503 RepID=A0A9N9LWR6_9HELO|nr:hypothetical protein HYALB_00005313 [Hymenoscyphus albidus]
MATRYLFHALEELGLISLWGSDINVKILCAQRFVRLFAYGATTLILVDYLASLDISKAKIGLFMTLTLVGDVIISLVLTLFADKLGRKAILAVGAVLMASSGVVFALSSNYWILLQAAVVGVISPGGNEIGPFRAIEESTLAQLVPATKRGDIFAWYTLLGTSGTALGFAASGGFIEYMRKGLAWGNIDIYRTLFWVYAGFGIVKLFLVLCLGSVVEAERKIIAPPSSLDPEAAPLLGDAVREIEPKQSKLRSLLPEISKGSWLIVVNLALLFALDSFASGLVPLSWVSFFFQKKFKLSGGTLGGLFFTTNIISALSMLIASSIAKRIGNVKTMVFTHLPSSIFLSLIPVPSPLPLAMIFLILRSCTASMDVVPRTAFLAAVVLPNERTAVMGVINVVKTASQSLGPLTTGILAQNKLFWVSFVTAGACKVTYDIGILALFAGHKTHDELAEERRQEARDEAERSRESGNQEEL